MWQISFLTIRDFIKSGTNFRTQIKTWDFVHPKYESFGWSREVRLEKPLIVTRKKDQYSNKFASLVLLRAMDDSIKFSEATLTVDETGQSGVLLKRVIYDFADFEVNHYSSLGKFESIYFDFAKASVFEASVEKIMSP